MKRLAILVALVGCGSSDDSESCPISIAAYCDGKTDNCPPTWTDAQNVASWRCGLVTLTDCGDVHVASVAYIDAGEDFYYDANGQLFRVEEFINTTQQCLAGSGEPIGSHGELACDDPHPVTLCEGS